ncbi:MAG: muconolactone delta-isomerase [Comamonadaceae bacterium]|nr:MAG: muconolactone delta-isomerase [Comamonadaceae bacterium]
MDFLVRIDVSALYALPAEEQSDVSIRERERGLELHQEGVLQQIWRLPGRRANIGLWTAKDADHLHEALTSLPIWPYADIEVTPLATHPISFSDWPPRPQT